MRVATFYDLPGIPFITAQYDDIRTKAYASEFNDLDHMLEAMKSVPEVAGQAYSLMMSRVRLETLIGELQARELHRTTESTLAALGAIERKVTPRKQARVPDENKAKRAESDAEDENDIAKQILLLRKDTIDLMERCQKMLEISLERYSHISYALYALGWTLGLVGRLYGGDGEEVGE